MRALLIATAVIGLVVVILVRGVPSRIAGDSTLLQAESNPASAKLKLPVDQRLRSELRVVPDEIDGCEKLALSATLAAYSVDRTTSLAGSAWSLVAQAAMEQRESQIELTLNSLGECSIPAGSWTLKSKSPEWAPVQGTIRALAGERVEVWVDRSYQLRLMVVDEMEMPVVGATVEWTPDGPTHESAYSPLRHVNRTPHSIAVSNDAGLVVIEAQSSIGLCTISAAGHERVLRHLVAPLTGLVVVVLRDSGIPDTEVRFVDAHTLAPLSGVCIQGESGFRSDASDDLGVLFVEQQLLSLPLLTAHGAQICDVLIRPERFSTGGLVPLPRSKTIKLTVLDSSRSPASGCEVWWDPVPGAGQFSRQQFLGRRTASTDATGAVELELPRDIPCTILAVSQAGESAESVLTASSVIDGYTIMVGAGREELELRIDSRRSSGARYWASVRYEAQRTVTITDNANNRIIIPHANRVTRFSVHGDGGRVRYFRRSASPDGSGHLDVLLSQSYGVDIALADNEDNPIPGILVRLTSKEQLLNSRSFPELNGGKPTSNTGWLEFPYAGIHGTSGIDGTARIESIPMGDYTVSFSPSAMLAGRHAEHTLYFPPRSTLSIPTASLVRYKLPALRRVSLKVINGQSKRAVEGFRITASFGLLGAEVRVVGDVWDGWVPQDAGSLKIVSNNGLSANVAVDHDLALGAFQAVYLFSDDVGRIVVTGLKKSALAGSIEVVATRQGHLMWEGRVSLREDFSAPLDVPFRNVAISLSPYVGSGFRYEFEPTSIVWRPGETIEFVARSVTVR